MSERVQQRRTRGWKKPVDAISCARGTKWGNPWQVVAAGHGEVEVIHRITGDRLVGALSPNRGAYWAVQGYKRHLAEHPELLAALPELRGHPLMCWCPLDAEWCHVDLLLELLAEIDA